LDNDSVANTGLLRIRLAGRFLVFSRAGAVVVYRENGGDDLQL
jgi:hypothetical protein